MSKMIGLKGNEAVAYAMKQINPDVVAAYPITPQTQIVQTFSEYVHNGEVDTEFVTVESEHSAMSAVVGASAAGARAMTATAANGLALMWEIVYIAASLRLPIVMPVVNRALSAPINIHGDHSDTMGARDAGWIQLYSENAQEAYDNVIQAVRIAEEAFYPVMVCMDGFIISHAMENVILNKDEDVKNFIGEPKHLYKLLDVKNPITVGPLDLFDYYFEHKASQIYDYAKVPEIVRKVGEEYGKKFGRRYDLVEGYMLDDAEIVIVAISSAAGTVKAYINEARKNGKKIGLLKLRMFRPFPHELVGQLLKDKKAIAVLDRSASFGAKYGPLAFEVKAALYDAGINAPFLNYVFGLGGRDFTMEMINKVVSDLEKAKNGEKVETFQLLGVRE